MAMTNAERQAKHRAKQASKMDALQGGTIPLIDFLATDDSGLLESLLNNPRNTLLDLQDDLTILESFQPTDSIGPDSADSWYDSSEQRDDPSLTQDNATELARLIAAANQRLRVATLLTTLKV